MGTLFINNNTGTVSACESCDVCEGMERSEIFDANVCNNYMREHFMKIGLDAVCGICMKVCKHNKH